MELSIILWNKKLFVLNSVFVKIWRFTILYFNAPFKEELSNAISVLLFRLKAWENNSKFSFLLSLFLRNLKLIPNGCLLDKSPPEISNLFLLKTFEVLILSKCLVKESVSICILLFLKSTFTLLFDFFGT